MYNSDILKDYMNKYGDIMGQLETLVTKGEGTIRDEDIEEYKRLVASAEKLEEPMVPKILKIKKPKRKYPSNYTPPKRRNRK